MIRNVVTKLINPHRAQMRANMSISNEALGDPVLETASMKKILKRQVRVLIVSNQWEAYPVSQDNRWFWKNAGNQKNLYQH